jgi:hypothetical protein
MMIHSKRRSPIWPYLGILACLFVLSVTAPRAWDRMSRREMPAQESRQRGTSSVARETMRRERSRSAEAAESAELAASRAIADQPSLEVELDPTIEPPAAPLEPSEIESISRFLDSLVPADTSDPPQVAVDSDVVTVQTAETEETTAIEPPREQPAEEEETSTAEQELAAVAPFEKAPPAEPSYDAVVVGSQWPLPRALVEQLNSLTEEEPTAVWARKIRRLIVDLCRLDSGDRDEKIAILKQLRVLSGHAMASTGPNELETRLARNRYALARWLDIWEAAVELEQLPVVKTSKKSSGESVKEAVVAALAISRRGASSLQWREYLDLDELRRLAASGTTVQRRAAARKVLDRLASPRLSQAQREFIRNPAIAELQSQLRAWAAEPVSAARVLAHLEQFERTGLTSDGSLVADDFRGLSWSVPSEAEKMSQFLDMHYRNANIRVAATGALLNRLVPQPQTTVSAVNDTVVNVPVYGSSTTLAKLYLRLVPDPTRIRFGLEARGTVASDTVSSSGPATFYNQGHATFLVRKLFVIGPHGLAVWPAVAEADNDSNYLVSMETGFDGVPLFGSLVRGIARNRYDDARGEARFEVEQKVAWRARTQLDEEIQPHLKKASENIEKKQMAALDRLGLELVPVEFSTTEERVVARVRLGNPRQLGASTPRPRAPSDSWLSLQVHQSAINNAAERLDLDGRSFDLPELFGYLAQKLDRPQIAKMKDLPSGVHVTFADKDAVRVRLDGDRILVTFAVAELTQEKHRWRNFTARASYRPEIQGLDAKFVRDETPVFLDGKSVKGIQAGLRAIFSKVLSRSRDISLVDEKMARDARLADLVVTQFVVDDGWIGLAYSPPRPPKMTRRAK